MNHHDQLIGYTTFWKSKFLLGDTGDWVYLRRWEHRGIVEWWIWSETEFKEESIDPNQYLILDDQMGKGLETANFEEIMKVMFK